MLTAPTIVSSSTKKMLTGTGIYKADCEPLLEKSLNDLIIAGYVNMND